MTVKLLVGDVRDRIREIPDGSVDLIATSPPFLALRKYGDCCENGCWRSGRVLDPFCGSGTTLAVAQGLGRDAAGIELYEANADLVRQRVGMFLDVA